MSEWQPVESLKSEASLPDRILAFGVVSHGVIEPDPFNSGGSYSDEPIACIVSTATDFFSSGFFWLAESDTLRCYATHYQFLPPPPES